MLNPWADINLKTVSENISYLQSISKPRKTLLVLKGNGYGLGAQALFDYFSKTNLVDYFGFIRTKEIQGLQLSKEKNLLLMTAPNDDEYEYLIKNDIEFTVYKKEHCLRAQEISKKLGKLSKVHIKVNTGMNRYGISPKHFKELYDFVQSLDSLQVSGVSSHFIDSYDLSTNFYNEQLDTFEPVVRYVKENSSDDLLIHFANSSGVLRSAISGERNSIFDMVRLGISAFGYFASNDLKEIYNDLITPSVELKAKIINIHDLEKGDSVGYSKRHVCDKKTKMAVVPMGYADGVSRIIGLTDYKVLVKGEYCDVLGTLQMDTSFIDVTDVDAQIGDEVVYVGNSGKNSIDADGMGEFLGIENYEVLIRMTDRLNKVYIK
jgi:alanine racemase